MDSDLPPPEGDDQSLPEHVDLSPPEDSNDFEGEHTYRVPYTRQDAMSIAADVVAAYVSNNHITPEQLVQLLKDVIEVME